MHSISIGGYSLSCPLGIGTMQWGTTWLDHKLNRGTVLDGEVEEVLRALAKRGVSFLDSAEGYGGGTSEERIRDAAHHGDRMSMEDFVVATKFLPTIWRVLFPRAKFFRSLEESRKRLGVDCIPVYFIHSPVHPLPLEWWIEYAAEAANKGLIKEIGLSNCNAEQVRRAAATARKFGQRISANQIMLNLLDYNSSALKETEKICKDLGITIIAYSPIGQGLLTDSLTPEKFSTIRAVKITRVTWDEIIPLRSTLGEIAKECNCNMAQVALNWTICHGHIPLVGCKNMRHVNDALGALDFKLSEEQVKRLDTVALDRSTLEKPRWRRGLFVIFISMLIFSYYIENFLHAWFGLGHVGRMKRRGGEKKTK